MSEAAETTEAEAPEIVAPTAEVAETPPAAEAKPDTARTGIENAAKQSGWAPKDQWKGDPDEWIDAPEFILKAVGEVLPSMRKSLQDSKAEVASLKKAVNTAVQGMSRAEKRGYDAAVRDIQARLDNAAAAGDVQGVRDATDEMVELTKEVTAAPKAADDPAEADPEFEAWAEENPWWSTDKVMKAAAVAIANEVEEETGLTKGRRFYAEVTKRVKEAFPAKFENPNRARPGTVEAPGATLRKQGKSFNDLPADAKAMCLEFEKDKIMTRDQYVKGFFQ
jgi:hypothetical protein